MSASINQLTNLSDDELVAWHSQHPMDNHYLTEMMHRHMNASADLGNKIWWLNFLLLVFTIAIAGLTGVLVWTAFRALK